MSTVNGTNLKKMTYNGQKVKKWIHNGVKVWSGATVVYYYHGSTLLGTKEVDEGNDVLRPSGISTAIGGYTMIGWATSNSESSIVTSLNASGETMTLYAIYLPNSYTAVRAELNSGGGTNISKQDTNYISGNIMCVASRAAYIAGGGSCETTSQWTIDMHAYRSVTITAATADFGYGDNPMVNARNWDGTFINENTSRTYSSNGTHTFYCRGTVGGGQSLITVGIGITSAVFSNPKPWT